MCEYAHPAFDWFAHAKTKIPGSSYSCNSPPTCLIFSPLSLSQQKNEGYTSLRIWGLTQYERVVYIDADTLVMECIDEVRKGIPPAIISLSDSICYIVVARLIPRMFQPVVSYYPQQAHTIKQTSPPRLHRSGSFGVLYTWYVLLAIPCKRHSTTVRDT